MPNNANTHRGSLYGGKTNNNSNGRAGSSSRSGSLRENAVHKPVPGRDGKGGKNK